MLVQNAAVYPSRLGDKRRAQDEAEQKGTDRVHVPLNEKIAEMLQIVSACGSPRCAGH